MLVPPQMGYRRPVNATRTSKVTAFPEKVEKVGRSAGGASKTWNFVAIPPPAPGALVPGRAFPAPCPMPFPAPCELGPQSRANHSCALFYSNKADGAVLCCAVLCIFSISSRTSLGLALPLHTTVPCNRLHLGCVAFLFSPERSLLLNPYQPCCAYAYVQLFSTSSTSSTFQGDAPCPM